MKVIGLTGGIASGKSTVSSILKLDYHFPIIDADQLAREVVEPGGKAIESIKDVFGASVLTPDGAMDRVMMGKLICEDSSAKEKLEAIIHPAIESQVSFILEDFRKKGTELIIYDCPLLIEAKQMKFVDQILLVVSKESVRIERLMARDGLDYEMTKKRIAIQMSDDQKQRYADQFLDNNGTQEDLKKRLKKIIESW